MKLLLDECVVTGLRRHLKGHQVITIAMAGWKGIRNGTLLTLAATAGYDAFIATDRGYQHQQNPGALPLPVVILLGKSNALRDLAPLVPRLLTELNNLRGGITIIS